MHIIVMQHLASTFLPSSSTPFYQSWGFGIVFSLVVGALLAGSSERRSRRRKSRGKSKQRG